MAVVKGSARCGRAQLTMGKNGQFKKPKRQVFHQLAENAQFADQDQESKANNTHIVTGTGRMAIKISANYWSVNSK